MMKRRTLLAAPLSMAAATPAILPAAASAHCGTYRIEDFQRVHCIIRHALREAEAALEHARGVVGADAAAVQLPDRLRLHLQAALSDETDGLDLLLGDYPAHAGHPARLLGGLHQLMERLTRASQIGALAVVRHGTVGQITAWEWTTQALEAAQRLWRPVLECYLVVRAGVVLPPGRSTPPC
jgi:hypothetical protein